MEEIAVIHSLLRGMRRNKILHFDFSGDKYYIKFWY